MLSLYRGLTCKELPKDNSASSEGHNSRMIPCLDHHHLAPPSQACTESSGYCIAIALSHLRAIYLGFSRHEQWHIACKRGTLVSSVADNDDLVMERGRGSGNDVSTLPLTQQQVHDSCINHMPKLMGCCHFR